MTKACSLLLASISIAHLMTSTVAAQTTGSQSVATAWRAVAENLPVGSIVKVRTTDGERLTAALLVADETGITVKPRTRIPMPSRRITFDRLNTLECYEEHVSFGKYVGVGAAVGASVFFFLLAGLGR